MALFNTKLNRNIETESQRPNCPLFELIQIQSWVNGHSKRKFEHNFKHLFHPFEQVDLPVNTKLIKIPAYLLLHAKYSAEFSEFF